MKMQEKGREEVKNLIKKSQVGGGSHEDLGRWGAAQNAPGIYC